MKDRSEREVIFDREVAPIMRELRQACIAHAMPITMTIIFEELHEDGKISGLRRGMSHWLPSDIALSHPAYRKFLALIVLAESDNPSIRAIADALIAMYEPE